MATIPRKRRASRRWERVIPCQGCNHPVSQRHHLLPVARYGENNVTANLCANCHEAYHIFDNALLDYSAKRLKSHAMRLTNLICQSWGGSDSPRASYIFDLVDHAHQVQRDEARIVDPPPSESDIRRRLRALLEEDDDADYQPDIRRGDMVRLTNGKVTRVVSVSGGYIHTAEGTHAPWQIAKVAKWE